MEVKGHDAGFDPQLFLSGSAGAGVYTSNENKPLLQRSWRNQSSKPQLVAAEPSADNSPNTPCLGAPQRGCYAETGIVMDFGKRHSGSRRCRR
jgi:hypothetical protein